MPSFSCVNVSSSFLGIPSTRRGGIDLYLIGGRGKRGETWETDCSCSPPVGGADKEQKSFCHQAQLRDYYSTAGTEWGIRRGLRGRGGTFLPPPLNGGRRRRRRANERVWSPKFGKEDYSLTAHPWSQRRSNVMKSIFGQREFFSTANITIETVAAPPPLLTSARRFSDPTSPRYTAAAAAAAERQQKNKRAKASRVKWPG